MAAKRDFTDGFLKAIKPAEKGKRVIYWDAVVPQFGIRVDDKSSPEDLGSFVLVARFPGSSNPAPRRIGFYSVKARDIDAAPVGGRMSLARAREIAREWRDDIAKGVDPKAKAEQRRREDELLHIKRESEEARRKAGTFRAVWEDYALERLSDSRMRSAVDVKRAVELHVMPVWQATPITEIKRADVKALHVKLAQTAPTGARRILSYLKTFGRWCEEEEILERSPFASVKPLGEEIRRDRVLTDNEIRAIWRACDAMGGVFGPCFKFMLVAGQRRSECGGLTWAEIDEKQRLWTIPRERAKNDTAHTVPLSDLARSIIAGRPEIGDYVFSLRDGPLRGWSKAKRTLDAIAFEKLREIAIEQGNPAPTVFPEWRLHDLRRTCATSLARVGTDRVVIGKILNHSEKTEVTAIYDRHRHDETKRVALDLWAQRLQAIIDGTDEEKVVPMRGGSDDD